MRDKNIQHDKQWDEIKPLFGDMRNHKWSKRDLRSFFISLNTTQFSSVLYSIQFLSSVEWTLGQYFVW